VLRENGHEVVAWDLNAFRYLKNNLEGLLSMAMAADCELVGITGIITQYKEVKSLIKAVRKTLPRAKIVCGGPLATSVFGTLNCDVDYVVLGEGEKAILRLVDNLERKTPPGHYLRSDVLLSEEELSEHLPYPAYDLFPVNEVYAKNPIGPYNTRKWIDGKGTAPRSINLVANRGCPFNCIFCYHNYMGAGYRKRSVSSVVDEMRWLKGVYEIEYFHFCDDSFACSKKWVLEFCEKVSDLDVTWSCTGRANIMDEDMAKAMSQAGCVGVWYGLESGSQKILDIMNKKATVEQYRKAVELNRKYFPFEDYTFMVGSPGETSETVCESIQFCKEMEIRPSAVFYMTPYPGTLLFEMLLSRDEKFSKLVLDSVKYDQWLESLGEQGFKLSWNCTMGSMTDDELREWHKTFIQQTNALNKGGES